MGTDDTEKHTAHHMRSNLLSVPTPVTPNQPQPGLTLPTRLGMEVKPSRSSKQGATKMGWDIPFPEDANPMTPRLKRPVSKQNTQPSWAPCKPLIRGRGHGHMKLEHRITESFRLENDS